MISWLNARAEAVAWYRGWDLVHILQHRCIIIVCERVTDPEFFPVQQPAIIGKVVHE